MENWNNPWKLISLTMAVIIVTALVTGVVVARWGTEPPLRRALTTESAQPEPAALPKAAVVRKAVPADRVAAPSPAPAPAARHATVPPESVINECNRYAAAPPSTRDKTVEVVKDAAIGAVAGAVLGAAGGAIADGGKGAGKGAAIGGIAGAGGGSLYGLYENKKNDEAYRQAYANCLSRRGY